ncbi:MAG: L,D-transpeptidase [Deltaproteobacteria bacterium]|nr:L,D-transpeptidase [Deltaproteobacteria bacterium]
MFRLFGTLGSTTVVACLLASSPAFAAWGLAKPQPPDPYDETQLGSALTDLALPDARTIDAHVRAAKDLDVGAILSVSLHELDGTRWVVDVVSLHPRWDDFYPVDKASYVGQGRPPKNRPEGGLGLTRVEVLTGADDDICDILGHWVVLRRGLTEMKPKVRVSIGDNLMVLEDAATDFRRIYPLGVGAIDQIRRPGELSSVTPTTSFGRLDKRESWEVMTFPKHFQDKPYLPLNVPRVRTDATGAQVLAYRPTWIAFHVWQPPRFARGFLSHGCIRMRDEDLAELAAVVYGVEDTVPVRIVAEPFPDAHHPHWKLTDRFYRLQNIGTKAEPKAWTINDVWKTEYVQDEPVPKPTDIVGITIDGKDLQELSLEARLEHAAP